MILQDKWRVSKQYRYCDWCDDVIAPGDYYRYLYGGEIRDKMRGAKYCKECGPKIESAEMPIGKEWSYETNGWG